MQKPFLVHAQQEVIAGGCKEVFGCLFSLPLMVCVGCLSWVQVGLFCEVALFAQVVLTVSRSLVRGVGAVCCLVCYNLSFWLFAG